MGQQFTTTTSNDGESKAISVVHFTASAKGWAQMWLRKNPYTVRTHHSKSTDKQHQEYDVSHIGCWIEPGRLSNACGKARLFERHEDLERSINHQRIS